MEHKNIRPQGQLTEISKDIFLLHCIFHGNIGNTGDGLGLSEIILYPLQLELSHSSISKINDNNKIGMRRHLSRTGVLLNHFLYSKPKAREFIFVYFGRKIQDGGKRLNTP